MARLLVEPIRNGNPKSETRNPKQTRNPKFKTRNPKFKNEEEHENTKERKIEEGSSFSAFHDFVFS